MVSPAIKDFLWDGLRCGGANPASTNRSAGINIDPYSPPSVRGVAPVKNQNAFFDAFDIKDGDKMFLAPAKRVTVW